jgi:UDP-N-acetylmuramyl-tripeptide synthetase
MEVSSHALTEARVDGVQFDVALLTNLTHDHLDYHGSLEAYAAAKTRLFLAKGLKTAVINVDDAFGRTLVDALASSEVDVVTYSAEGRSADYRAGNIRYEASGFQFLLSSPAGEQQIKTRLSGAFNVANVLGVSASLVAMGVEADRLPALLETLTAPAGRMETVQDPRGVRIVIDYAHTPDALQKVLQSLRVGLSGRLIAVFGCGGDRDRAKRPFMGAAAEAIADIVILTSDNPRFEDPVAILSEIAHGMQNAPYGQMLDRALAIRQAIDLAEAGDVVLVAGKGHEPYQEVEGVRQPFSDRAVVEALVASRGESP